MDVKFSTFARKKMAFLPFLVDQINRGKFFFLFKEN
jgi:hypothetical protein